MFEALRKLAETMGIDPVGEGRTWKDVLAEMIEVAKVHKESHDYLNADVYDGYYDEPYDGGDYSDDPMNWGDEDEYLYDEGLDYLQGGY